MNPEPSEPRRILNRHGLRPTRARLLLLSLLLENEGHPSAEEIIETLRLRGNPISIATLYQNLNHLVEAGLLKRVKGLDSLVRYDANLVPHSHLVCEGCGRMIDIRAHTPPATGDKPLAYHSGGELPGWDVRTVRVEYRGTCPSCRKK